MNQNNDTFSKTIIIIQLAILSQRYLSLCFSATNFALGSTLESFKSHVEGMDAETKGLAIGNSPQVMDSCYSFAVLPALENHVNNFPI